MTDKKKTSNRWQDGMYRIVRDGVPGYYAPWVRELTPHGKGLLMRGSNNPKPKATDHATRHAETLYLPPEA